MPILFVLLGILLLTAILFLQHRKNRNKKKQLYPNQEEIVRYLINDIKTAKIDVILSEKGPQNSSATLNLFSAGEFTDNGKELSDKKYNDFKLFFTDSLSQIINFKKYLDNPFLPIEILEELKHFYNTSYTREKSQGLFFIVITDIAAENQSNDDGADGLLLGNARAFQSWKVFKEDAHNLRFVISQWLKENEKPDDFVFTEKSNNIDFV